MTKEKRRTATALVPHAVSRHSSFGFDSSFWFRHSGSRHFPHETTSLVSCRSIAILPRSIFPRRLAMALDLKPGQTIRVTVSKNINRESARKTLERLFLQDKSVAKPIAVRSANFIELPKRRGGQIWTKRPNKVHPELKQGASATIKTTPQSIRDLASVAAFVDVK